MSIEITKNIIELAGTRASGLHCDLATLSNAALVSRE
jgi:hypothetical protein